MGGKGSGGKGGGGSTVNVQPSPYEQQMATIAKNYYDQTQQARDYMLQDFSSFLRPSGFTNQGVYGTGSANTGNAGTSTGGTSSTPLSSTFSLPSTDELTNNLRLAYGGLSGPYANANQAQGYLANLGYSPISGANLPQIPSERLADGSINPEFTNWTNQQALGIRQNLMQKQGQTQAQTPSGGGGGSSGFTSSNLYNPYNLPAYAPLYQLARTGLESQYGQARQNILSSSPRGGALSENLANLEMGRAQQAGALPATIAAPLIQDIYNKAYGVAFGAPQTTLGGLGGAASSYNATQGINASGAMQQAALNQQSQMGLGAGIGGLLSLGMKGLTAPSTSVLGNVLGL